MPIQDLAHLPMRLRPRSQQDSPDPHSSSEEQTCPIQLKAHFPLEQHSPDAQFWYEVHDFSIQDLAQCLARSRS